MKKEDLQQIMIAERLYDWTLEISKGGWHCFQRTKRITIANTKNFSLFLHEIAQRLDAEIMLRGTIQFGEMSILI